MENKTFFLEKGKLTQFINYLFLVPFLLGFRPLLINYNPTHIIIYLLGLIFILILIYISNHSQYLRISENEIGLFLEYKEAEQIIPFKLITKYVQKRNGTIIVYLDGHPPYRIYLDKKARIQLKKELDKNI